MNKRLIAFWSFIILILTAAPALAAGPRVRVVHASPDAPPVDVLVDDAVAFDSLPFTRVTDYASLAAGTYNIKVVPAGDTAPVVIEADLDLADDTDYTVVAVGELANNTLEPLPLVDNNSAPAAGKAHVRFVHASPDAPAVDIVVKGGPALFSNIAFKEAGDYTPVDAGRYDLEVRISGTDTVALDVPGVALMEGGVYTVFAMGLAGAEPSLRAVPSLDAEAAPATMPTTGGVVQPLLPADGYLIILYVGLVTLAVGLTFRFRQR